MKRNFITLFLAVTALVFTSCSNDDDNNNQNTGPVTVETQTFTNLFANQTGGQGEASGGSYTKFSFSQNAVVTGDDWDVAFRGTTILVNGGAAMATDEPARTGQGAVATLSGVLFNEVSAIPTTGFTQDSATGYAIPTGSGNGWYSYNSETHIITAVAGKVFVVKTHDGKYAKMEILSYYKDAPSNPTIETETRYYTFNFAYQPEGTTF